MAGYPLDAPNSTLLAQLRDAPYPRYPFAGHAWLSQIFPPSFYAASLSPIPVFAFAATYYALAHYANTTHAKPPRDLTRGEGLLPSLLRQLVRAHNLLLALYSAATFALMAPPVVDMFLQGYRAAGSKGLALALCSIPTNEPYLGRWAWIFYISKYYEVVDSLILYLKGKQIGQLQSYHHAGALVSMWIAVRYQSQPVFVFCVWNSFTHAWMFLYYFFTAMHWPFPRALKRSLTTLQIAQIASGTILTNVYLLTTVQPSLVLAALNKKGIHSALPAWLFAAPEAAGNSAMWFASANKAMDLSTYAAARAVTRPAESCLQSKGAEIALHVNTLYMTPLLMLFAQFFMRSYLTPAASASEKKSSKNKAVAAAVKA